MGECRRHASAAGEGCFPVESEAMFLSILFAHHKSLSELCDRLDRVRTFLGQSISRAEERTQNLDQKRDHAPAGTQPTQSFRSVLHNLTMEPSPP